MAKHLRRLRQVFRQRWSHDREANRLGELSIRDLNALSRSLLITNQDSKEAIIIEGLVSSPGAGLSVDLTSPAVAVQKVGSDDLSAAISTDVLNVVLAAADPTNPRIDIIEARVAVREANNDSRVDVVDPVSGAITPQSSNRDFEVYIEIQSVTGTPAVSPVPPSTTAGTAGNLIGSVTTDILDCSVNNILKISFGVDGEFVEVDISGAVPSATTLVERIAAINTAFAGYGTVAFNNGGALQLKDITTGELSVFKIAQPLSPSADAYNLVLGGVQDPAYYDEFVGGNSFFKVAEIFVPVSAVSLTSGDVRSREEKDTQWDSDAATIENGLSFEAHRKLARMDHPDGSVFFEHLDPGVASGITQKLTLFRGPFSPIYSVPGDPTGGRKGTILLHNIDVRTVLGAAQTIPDQEQEFPVNRVDQRQDDVSGVNYVVLTSLSEAPADKIGNFVPSASADLIFTLNHSRAGVYINSVGSGYTHLRIELHDAGNSQLAVVDIPFAFLTTGWNYGNLTATLIDAQTYHYHVYAVGFTAGSTPNLGTDGGAVIAYREMYLPVGGKFGSANSADVIHILDADGNDLMPVRLSGDDDILSPGDGFIGETGFDVMAADLSSDAFWNSISYQEYALIDLTLGRIKLPAGLALDRYNPIYVAFNISEGLDETDAKNFNRHNSTETVEDNLERLEYRDFLNSSFRLFGSLANPGANTAAVGNAISQYRASDTRSVVALTDPATDFVSENNVLTKGASVQNNSAHSVDLENGKIATFWKHGSTTDVRGVVFDLTTSITQPETTLFTSPSNTCVPALLDNGNIVLVYDDGVSSILFRVFDQNLVEIVSPVTVTITGVSPFLDKVVVAGSLTGGKFMVVWSDTTTKTRFAIYNNAGTLASGPTDIEAADQAKFVSASTLPIPGSGDVRVAVAYQDSSNQIKRTVIKSDGSFASAPLAIGSGHAAAIQSPVNVARINEGSGATGADFAVIYSSNLLLGTITTIDWGGLTISAASTFTANSTLQPKVSYFFDGRWKGKVFMIWSDSTDSLNRFALFNSTGGFARPIDAFSFVSFPLTYWSITGHARMNQLITVCDTNGVTHFPLFTPRFLGIARSSGSDPDSISVIFDGIGRDVLIDSDESFQINEKYYTGATAQKGRFTKKTDVHPLTSDPPLFVGTGTSATKSSAAILLERQDR